MKIMNFLVGMFLVYCAVSIMTPPYVTDFPTYLNFIWGAVLFWISFRVVCSDTNLFIKDTFFSSDIAEFKATGSLPFMLLLLILCLFDIVVIGLLAAVTIVLAMSLPINDFNLMAIMLIISSAWSTWIMLTHSPNDKFIFRQKRFNS